jgi:hypothetical protein
MQFSEWCKALQAKEDGPHIFRTHMLNSERISSEEFFEHCSLESILDEDETIEEYLSYNPDANFYRVNLPESPSYIMAHGGFEAFFTPEGRDLTHFDVPGNRLMEEQLWGAGLAKVVAPANSAAAVHNGFEKDRGMITDKLQHLEGNNHRYLWHDKGVVVAGLLIKDNVVDMLYVCKSQNMRRVGYATALFKAVKEIHPELHHSTNLTNDGKAFVQKSSFEPSM